VLSGLPTAIGPRRIKGERLGFVACDQRWNLPAGRGRVSRDGRDEGKGAQLGKGGSKGKQRRVSVFSPSVPVECVCVRVASFATFWDQCRILPAGRGRANRERAEPVGRGRPVRKKGHVSTEGRGRTRTAGIVMRMTQRCRATHGACSRVSGLRCGSVTKKGWRRPHTIVAEGQS
jgi:hypothetical protein